MAKVDLQYQPGACQVGGGEAGGWDIAAGGGIVVLPYLER